MGAAKILTSNLLRRTSIWDKDPGGLSLPPTASASAFTNYAGGIGAAAAHRALISDGDQNLPLFLSGSPSDFSWTFNNAIIPKAIAIINHNCYETGDKIEIIAGANPSNPILIATIQSPNRSADIFYPLRFNDAWVNTGSVNQPWWQVQFTKASGNPYVGEIFFATDYYEFEDFMPQPNYDIAMQLSRRKASHEFYSGESADYDLKSPVVPFGLDWSRKDVKSGSFDLFMDWVPKHMDALNQSPSRQVLIWRDDRVCMFGRLEESAALGWFPDKSFTPRYVFRAEYPRRFFRDELD